MIYVTEVHMVGGIEHEHIDSVRWRDPATGESGQTTRAEMVDWINRGGDARVADGLGWVQIGVVNAIPAYVRTHKDGRWTDNLLALPRY